MLGTLTQDNKNGKLTTPLGADVLLMRRMDGTEGLSEPFEFRVEALSTEADLALTDVVGQICEVTYSDDGGTTTRYFNGYCTEARWLGFENRLHRYEVVLRPWLWLLTRTTDSRIFHEKTVVDIIKAVFDGAGFTNYEDKLTGSYPTLHYTVQYMETHFNFVSRLMEKFGIYYYFKHEAGVHKLVLADGISSHTAVPGHATVPFYGDGGARSRDDKHIYQWSTAQVLRTGKAVYKDYAYERASSDLKDEHTQQAGHAKDNLELYVYPGAYDLKANGKKLATYRVQAEHAQTSRRFAAGNVPAFCPGFLYTLEKHPADGQNIEYLLARATHTIVNSDYVVSSRASPQQIDYHGAYECLASDIQYRAPIRTPRALIPGPQTALVIKSKNAPADEEIDVDNKGRILVHFYWDRYASGSKRLRIAQGIAGKGWGMQYTPRIGQEVVIGYVEGDPDQPFVAGGVYNSDNAAPIAMPGDKTQSTWKSDSSKGHEGFNEIRFEDKKDSEEIYIHAERNRKMEIEHNDDIIIGADQTETIAGSRTFELTAGDLIEDIKGTPGKNDKFGTSISKSGHRTTTIHKGNDKLQIKEGTLTTLVDKGDETHTVAMGKRTTEINGNDTLTVKQGNLATTVKMGNVTTNIDMGNQTTTLKMGGQTFTLNLGKHTTDARLGGIELKCGPSSIKVELMGITIKGPMLTLEGSGMATLKAPMTTVKGDAMLMLSGGMIMVG